MPEERRRKKKKKSRRNRSGDDEDDASPAADEEQPLQINQGEAEFANASAIHADNQAVAYDANGDIINDAEEQPVLTLLQEDDGAGGDEDAIPSPIDEPFNDNADATNNGGLDDNGFTQEGLAVAMAVDSTAEDEYIYAAIEYDPDSKPPLHKNRRFRVYTCMALMVVIAVVVVVVVYATKSAKDPTIIDEELLYGGAPTGVPTPSPLTNRETSGVKEQIEAGVLQRGVNFTGMDESDPRYLALDWILHYDQLQLDSDDKNLYQRYVLALLAFTLDSTAWYTCGEHRKFGNVTENFVVEDCKVENAETGQIKDHKVWLSSTEECEWYGVICSADEVVRGVELMGNDLIGQIPPEISELRFLQYLALNGNCLYGTIPPEFGKMPNLLSLELHGNGLSGELPASLQEASKLQLLNVAMQYQFSSVCRRSNGTIVNTLFKMGNPYGGEYNGGLAGPVLGANVSMWSSMKGLHLFDNSFSGYLDEKIGDLKYLVFLRAQNNIFSSWLPNGMTNLKKLREVYLGKNGLKFDLPPNIGDMEDLEDLRLNENPMNGTIPESLYNLDKLKYLWLQDTLNCQGGECAMDSKVGFSGSISTNIGNLKKLSWLLIDNNPFEGSIPTEIGLCENLAVLHIHKTNIKGSSPKELCFLRDKELNNENNAGVFYADCRPNNKTEDPFFKFDEERLAVARPVDSSEDEPVYPATKYTPEVRTPFYKQRRYIIWTIVVFVVVAVTVVFATKEAVGEDPPLIISEREAAIKPYIQAHVLQRNATWDTMAKKDPRHLALNWILHQDKMKLERLDERLSQRFILALLAFSFDSLAWDFCGNHTLPGKKDYVVESCQVPDEAGRFEEHSVWLSNNTECDWWGVTCVNDSVTGLDMISLKDNCLIGTIPPEIGNMESLKYL
ncbi:hypothetical protein ACHAXR_013414 [Thalassiosira sp. AJA248-18]